MQAIGCDVPDGLVYRGIEVETLRLEPKECPELAVRYLGDARRAVYLMRPDQHVAARWLVFDGGAVGAAVARATGQVSGGTDGRA